MLANPINAKRTTVILDEKLKKFSYITLYRFLFNFLSLKHHSSSKLYQLSLVNKQFTPTQWPWTWMNITVHGEIQKPLNTWTVTFACSNNFKETSFRRPNVWIYLFIYLFMYLVISFWPLCKENQSLRSKDSKGSRCVTEKISKTVESGRL